jgi:hypothetical protein
MWLFLDTDADPRTGWEGFDFVVNRRSGPDGAASLERNTGGWGWEQVEQIPIETHGTELQFSIPRASLKLHPGTALRLDFQWADNLQNPGDILDGFVNGDVAPEGRFRYRYVAE